MKFYSKNDYNAEKNSLIKTFNLEILLREVLSDNYSEIIAKNNFSLSDAWIHIGGWQSWNPGYEIPPEKKQLSLHCHIVKPFNRYLEMPGSLSKESKNIILGHFVTYLRWNNFYICFASTGNIQQILPPVQFIFNRNENTIGIELCDTGKYWKKNELQAEIEIFYAESYFELKDKLKSFFGSSESSSDFYSNRFDQIDFLGKTAAGWESWYNHYSFIDEKLILEDLETLSTTNNILTLGQFNNIVFQIDDGWESALGDWTIRKDRFPEGLKSLTDKIAEKNYIPGLWIAPFVIDLRCSVAKQHSEWILKNSNKKPIPAGFNPLWGDKFGKNQPGFPGSFYCLDLSIPDVIDYLDKIIERAIEEWGFRYLKLDFLYAGMINGCRKNPGAAYEYYAKAIKQLTSRKINSKGEKIAYLGCGAPFELSFTDLPLCRIGCDTYEHWENNLPKKLQINGRNSAYLNLTDSIGRAFWDKIIYANDPDVIFIRNENCSLTRKQKLLIGTVAALFGSQIMYSDDPGKSNSKEEIKLTEEIIKIFEKYKNEEFGIKPVRENIYEIFSRNQKYKGIINLEEGYADIQ